jgi:tetratricopeptide (TPR) repeat protein
MAKTQDFSFEIQFCESILQRQADDTDALELLAGYYTKAGRIAEGLQMDQRLVDLLPDNPTHHYNLACSQCLSGDHEQALGSLQRALTMGYRDFAWIRKDPDLRRLRKDPRFTALLHTFEKASHVD